MVRNGQALLWPVHRNGVNRLSHCPIVDPAPEKFKDHGVSYGLGEAGYDIRLKQNIIFNARSNPVYRINNDPVVDGRFVIASAIEQFDMPDDLVGIVHDKSTWARQGLSVFNTVIEPGFCGGLTLELVYHGNKDLHIPAGSGIAQVMFHEITCKAKYNGKYQGQSGDPEESRFE